MEHPGGSTMRNVSNTRPPPTQQVGATLQQSVSTNSKEPAVSSPVVASLSTSMKRSWPRDSTPLVAQQLPQQLHHPATQHRSVTASSTRTTQQEVAAVGGSGIQVSSELMRKASDLSKPGGWVPANLKPLVQELILRDDATVRRAIETNNMVLLLDYLSKLPAELVVSLCSASSTQQSMATSPSTQPMAHSTLNSLHMSRQNLVADYASVGYPAVMHHLQQNQHQEAAKFEAPAPAFAPSALPGRSTFLPPGPQPSATRPRLSPSPVLLQGTTGMFAQQQHAVGGQTGRVPTGFPGPTAFSHIPPSAALHQQATLVELLQQSVAGTPQGGSGGGVHSSTKRTRPLSMASLVSFREQNRPKTGLGGMLPAEQQQQLSAIMSLGNYNPVNPMQHFVGAFGRVGVPSPSPVNAATRATVVDGSSTFSVGTTTPHASSPDSAASGHSPFPEKPAGSLVRREKQPLLASSRGYSKKKSQPSAAPRRWSVHEDNLLREAVKKYKGKDWKLVAEQVPGRSHVQCLQRWRKALDPGVVKGHWTVDEDTRLLVLISENPKNWGHVARGIEGRTAKQCRERYHNHLDPSIRKGDWTKEEDEIIITKQNQVGNKWAEISKFLPGRTENSVKIRWKSIQRQGKNNRNKNRRAAAGKASAQADQHVQRKHDAAHAGLAASSIPRTSMAAVSRSDSTAVSADAQSGALWAASQSGEYSVPVSAGIDHSRARGIAGPMATASSTPMYAKLVNTSSTEQQQQQMQQLHLQLLAQQQLMRSQHK